MARPSTLPKSWLALAKAVGGLGPLREQLGWSYMVLFRRARGKVKIPLAERLLVDKLAERYKVASPFGVSVDELELLGKALTMGFPPSDEETARLRARYPEAQLVELAEDEETSEDVLRAVTHLLGV